jgi:hypothetical protein
MKNKNIIGLGGVAGAGKDLFFTLLSQKLNVKRFSLADELKRETCSWCLEHYGFDSVNCSRREKETLRPFLVFHGAQKRNRTNGRYWIEKLSQKIKNNKSKNIVITDIRYDDYEKDEVYWLKKELGGKLIHLRQYEEIPDPNEGALVRSYRGPVNDEEARNDPKIREKADYKIDWLHIKEVDHDILWKKIEWVTCLFQ